MDGERWIPSIQSQMKETSKPKLRPSFLSPHHVTIFVPLGSLFYLLPQCVPRQHPTEISVSWGTSDPPLLISVTQSSILSLLECSPLKREYSTHVIGNLLIFFFSFSFSATSSVFHPCHWIRNCSSSYSSCRI